MKVAFQEAVFGNSGSGYFAEYPKTRVEKNVATGERHGRAKLTEEQVVKIRSDTSASHAQLAREFNVSEKAIRLIRKGSNWKAPVPQAVPQN
jgi:hypothetical protein